MKASVEIRNMSLANLTVGRTPQAELVWAAAKSGFGKVGLLVMTATSHPLHHEVLGKPEVIREIKTALRETGVRVFDIEAFVLSPLTDLERFKPALELGAELGATHISSIGTELAPHATFLSRPQRIDLFGRLCEQAAGFGLSVGIEFMLYRDIRTWRDALDLVEAAGSSNAGLILDVLHFHRGGGTASDIGQIPAERIAYAQLSDCERIAPPLEGLAGEARTSRLHLGDGVIPLHGILGELPAQVQLVIETPVAAEATSSTLERAQSAAQNITAFFSTRYEAPGGA
ncbi:sugar phosphate isomerase/epimerase [Burkholderia sp. Bp9140]|uniref:sugar phosphate isomerase/epimerase family protein n=1 Tax=Burkholderia sp. Bp9140 TaxID=2184572 RepID=UPI000F55F44E|nr:sugar phosphate isomerase/epimerase [Burkholderia sp. Bp9140]RQR44829.1 sugar phosphate isomerase/epimerase [Burkholderia sp. Bp9140]